MIGDNLILTIGIDQYNDPVYPTLDNAKDDALRVLKIMQEVYNFKPTQDPLLNSEATKENIIEALVHLRACCTEDDNLIIYYAGHGIEDPVSGKGIWVPIDGVNKSSRLIYDAEILARIETISAKHILLISDSCFSGKLFQQKRSPITSQDYSELESKKSRWVLYSGEQTVGDGLKGKGTPFCISICQFLDTQKGRVFSGGELFQQVITDLTAQKRHMPGARFIDCGHEGGQMIFRSNTLSVETKERGTYTKHTFPLPEPKSLQYYLPRTVTAYDQNEVNTISFFRTDKERLPLKDLIQTQKRIVLLGSAGSGKSVELIEMSRFLQQRQSPIVPVYKRFNTYTDENIEAYLPAGWEAVNPSSLILFMDGLDEVQPSYFHVTLRKIIAFADKHPSIGMVVSCRSNFYDLPRNNFSGSLNGFTVYNLNDISKKEIVRYVDEYYGIRGEEFMAAVGQAGMEGLIQKPYFLDIIIRYYIYHGDLKGKRSAIMEDALENYYWENKEHFNTTGPIAMKEQAFTMLEKIAFVIEVMGKNFISDKELLTLFPDTSQLDNCQFLPAFRRDNEKDQWMFEHNNIQEYLASRVLARESFANLTAIISQPLADKRKIKPTWVNTLSFLISIASDSVVNPLLEWILDNDREVLIRFEAGRLAEDKRIAVFKKIVADYNDKQIWISSNKFSDEDLAAFGYFSEILDYLLSILEYPDLPRIARLNALHILRNFSLKDFSNYHDRVKKDLLALLELLETGVSDPYGVQSVLGTMAKLGITDKQTTELIVTKYAKRLNQHIRAGLYKFLHHSPFVDDYVEVFLDGLEISQIEGAVDDREPVNLMDESFHLKIGIEKIIHPDALLKMMKRFGDKDRQRMLFFSDYKEVLTAIVENTVEAFKVKPSLFTAMLDFYKDLVRQYNRDITKLVLPFFELTGTKWKALQACWQSCKEMNAYQTSEYCEFLMDEQNIANLIDEIIGKEDTKENILKLHEIVDWNRLNIVGFEKLLPLVESTAKQHNVVLPGKKEVKDWGTIEKAKTQSAFDMLFEKQALAVEIEKIFIGMKKTVLSSDDLYGLHSNIYRNPEDSYSLAALDALRNQTSRGMSVTRKIITAWMADDSEFLYYVMDKIYQYLHGNSSNYIAVSKDQEEVICNWCVSVPLPDNILWFFLNRFNLKLSDTRLLGFTYYFDYNNQSELSEPGTIDHLESFIAKHVLRDHVIKNLTTIDMTPLAWTSNAAYAIRNNIREAYPSILVYLENAGDREYKVMDILALWYHKTNDTARLKTFINNASSEEFKWKAVSMLIDAGKDTPFLLEYLQKRMNDSNTLLEYRFIAANHLMKFGHLGGFTFAAQYIIDDPDPSFDFERNLKNFRFIVDTQALDLLIPLLAIARQPIFQKDNFNNLESKLMDAFYTIGIQSDSNFSKVKQALEQFMVDNEGKFEHLNFLHVRIAAIEEQLSMVKLKKITIADAINEFNKLST